MTVINTIPVRIGVTGVTGRMGKEIIRCIATQNQQQKFNKKIILGAAIVRAQSTVCGMDIGKFMRSDVQGIKITDNIESVKENFDILIDFTAPEITIEYLKFCMVHGKNIIIGTTGFTKTHLDLIKSAAQKIGIIYSANFSIGITVMLKLLKDAAKTIGSISNIDIIELHHNKKNDIPSGTALMMREVIKSNIESKTNILREIRSCDNNISQILSPSSFTNDDVQIHSIRSGDIIGEHAVLFSGTGERLEIIHKACNRNIFANGALYSAMWLGKTKIGLFDLNDVLMFKNNHVVHE